MRHDRNGHAMQRVNGLAWCAQAVMQAAVEMNEAATGSAAAVEEESGFEHERVATHLTTAAEALDRATVADGPCRATATRLRELAAEVRGGGEASAATVNLEGLRAFADGARRKIVCGDQGGCAGGSACWPEGARSAGAGSLSQPHGPRCNCGRWSSSLNANNYWCITTCRRLSLFYMSQQ